MSGNVWDTLLGVSGLWVVGSSEAAVCECVCASAEVVMCVVAAAVP